MNFSQEFASNYYGPAIRGLMFEFNDRRYQLKTWCEKHNQSLNNIINTINYYNQNGLPSIGLYWPINYTADFIRSVKKVINNRELNYDSNLYRIRELIDCTESRLNKVHDYIDLIDTRQPHIKKIFTECENETNNSKLFYRTRKSGSSDVRLIAQRKFLQKTLAELEFELINHEIFITEDDIYRNDKILLSISQNRLYNFFHYHTIF